MLSRKRFISSFALPTALAVAVIVIWARSYRYMDEWSMATDQGEVRAVAVYQGAIHVVRTHRMTAATRPISYDCHEIPAGATWDDLHRGAGVAWNYLGFRKMDWALPTQAAATAPAMPPRRPVAPWIFSIPNRAWTIPFWPFLALAGFPILRRGVAIIRHRRRLGQNRCPTCAYDLRGTPGHCPECGWRQGARAGT
jgi:hypothetical protein